MSMTPHTATEFAQAMRHLLPPGEAWQWGDGGLGASLLDVTAQELARVDATAAEILQAAVQTHVPVDGLWRVQDYLAVAHAVDASVSMQFPRPFAAGLGVAGGKLWSDRARYVMLVRYGSAGLLATLRAALAKFKQAHVAIFYEAAQGGGYSVELSDA